MTTLSWAQNQEDVMLWRSLKHVPNGFYIDVGAAEPGHLSVTRLFYENGWNGINIEPNPQLFQELGRARARDINLMVGVADVAETKTFFRIGTTGLSTFDAAIAQHHADAGWEVERLDIACRTLTDICEEHRPEGPIHFLKIDVEGGEGAVLAGMDLQRFRPWIILLEATRPLSQEEDYGWEPSLLGAGYRFVWFDGLNRFYLAEERCGELGKHFQVQPNVFDDAFRSANLPVELEAALSRAVSAEAQRDGLQAELQEAGQKVAALEASLREAQDSFLAHQQAAERKREVLEADRDAARTQWQQAELEIRSLKTRLGELRVTYGNSLRDALSEAAEAARRKHEHAEQRIAEALRQSRKEAEETARWEGTARTALLRAEQAEARFQALQGSTSWRVTAPLRAPVHLLRGDLTPKDVARRIFHKTLRCVRRVPGGRPVAKLFGRVMPRASGWLELRYRYYDQAAAQRLSWPMAQPETSWQQPMALEQPNHSVTATPDARHNESGLGEREGNMYRYLANLFKKA
ncbi:FkbM family methyltransferase [Roseomonas gilardii]|uniref:FkbM family methyltransferase n=2 Tax=Roseomonas gilardii TaxID=257708 RepID=UPI0009DE24FC|nr:FkbM family methyltransferase [Roseomonas gilardii]